MERRDRTSLILILTACLSKCRNLPRNLAIFCVFSMILVNCVSCDDQQYPRTGASYVTFFTAFVNITYKDPNTSEPRSEKSEIGRFGTSSRLDTEWGYVIHVRTNDNKTHGCTPPVNVPKERWIALVERGHCKFTHKIYNAAVIKNASAVVIYNHLGDELITMDHNVDDIVSIFISKEHGERIAALVDNGTRVLMQISLGKQVTPPLDHINKTSVLFVSISFIVLMIISLAWLVFYYIQRFRYAHAKERLSKRLMNAAKKAITKMPLRTIKNGDRETDSDFDQCAVCIENYRASDVIRILPCKHLFHRSCVDPWLIEQRSCPMCKLDILKAYGLQIHGSRDSIANIDVEGPSTSIGPSEIVPHESSREIDSDGVEVIRFQPAQCHVEYHDAPQGLRVGKKYSLDKNGAIDEDSTIDGHLPGDSTMESGDEGRLLADGASDSGQRRLSMDSVHSVDSEANELQSLMPAVPSDGPEIGNVSEAVVTEVPAS